MPQTYLMLLWHMHQPYYKDLVDNQYAMPWVRLHALKDYFGMVAMLRDFPNVHVTFNMVPSLVAQLEEYANDSARELPYELAFKPIQEMKAADREQLVSYAFQINHENLLNRYPRFRELYDKAYAGGQRPKASRLSNPQDFVDLQVLSQLAWFDEIYLESDPVIRSLAARKSGYTSEDKAALRRKEIELIQATLKEYRSASERGQVELSTSPFYHPILPLLCDTQAGAESTPGLPLPHHRFRHPEDARDQLRAAIALHRRVFGSTPAGLWPSEGSVSEEALRLAADEGFRWAATDEGVLGRSLQMGFYRQSDGTVHGGHELYRPQRFMSGARELSLFFRDHQISDLIGFVYSHMDPHAAAWDLYNRIRGAGYSPGSAPAVVSVILDGENAWEYYPGNGRAFLKAFYNILQNSTEVQAVTASEAMQVRERGVLPRLVPGSWINANFNVWIGASEDNRAWDLLSDARDFFAQASTRPGLDPARLELARQELWIAEGSDWCWWYGPEHSTANDEEFDLLFRKHLGNIYRLLGGVAPDDLAAPIKRLRVGGLVVPPSGRIAPTIDGRQTSYFEWMGAGVYAPDERTGSLHGARHDLDALYYGFSEKSLFLRVDLKKEFIAAHPEFEIRINAEGSGHLRVHARILERSVDTLEVWVNDHMMNLQELPGGSGVQAVFDSILEMTLEFETLGILADQKINVQVALWVNGLPVQVIPAQGWLALEMTEEVSSW